MSKPLVERDERTVAVENASYRWSSIFLSYGLLIIISYRAFLYRESNWDLMLFLVASGILTTLYQARYKVLSRRWLVDVLLVMVLSATVAAAMIIGHMAIQRIK
jgi:hypothetical protein